MTILRAHAGGFLFRIINETVQVAKEFIDAELAKYETWGELAKKAGVFTSLLCSMSKESKGQYPPKWYFNQAKAQGAGRNIICAFLGGNWKAHMIFPVADAFKKCHQTRTASRRATFPGLADIGTTVQEFTVFGLRGRGSLDPVTGCY